ncbi:MAG: adenosine deaminase [Litoreibacter sp.]
MRHLPKVELHLHLEGAAPPRLIKAMAQEKSVDLSGIFDDGDGYAFGNFQQFLNTYEAATSVLQSPEDFHRLTLAVLEQSAEQGVIYTEAFISPDFCGNRDVSAWRDYLAAMQEAAEIAKSQSEIELRAIVTCIRHFGPEKAKETALCAAETFGSFVTGFGMGGDEMAGNPSDFTYAFDMAREAGLRLTTHAGEWGGAASVRDSLTHLKVERIGHGVHAIQDRDLIEYIAGEGIILEVCPGSNIALGVYPSLDQHPIQKLHDAGVKVTVSTDDPPFFHTDLISEYENLERTFGWDDTFLTSLNMTAAEAAFCDAQTRDTMISKLKAL